MHAKDRPDLHKLRSPGQDAALLLDDRVIDVGIARSGGLGEGEFQIELQRYE